MTRPRPYRAALHPYEAARTVVVAASLDKFDRTIVRAFLDTISLFPIGSFVELSNGRRAQVLRANPGFHTRPVIEAVDTGGASTGEIIDLSEAYDLRVVRAATREEAVAALPGL